MKLHELNESVVELERLDELDLSTFTDFADKISDKITKIYYNNFKGEQTPEVKRAFRGLEKTLARSALDKEWADEIFKNFDHTKTDLTVEEVDFYITQVEEADAYIRAQQAAEAAKKAKKARAEKLLAKSEEEFKRLVKLQAKAKTMGKVASERQKKIDDLEKVISTLKKELEA